MKAKSLLLSTLAISSLAINACALAPQGEAPNAGRIISYESGAGGFNTKTYFYEAQEEVVAFDAQFTPELARESIAHLRKFTQKPISWLVVTHPNPDKFNGMQVFQKEGAKVIASEATVKALRTVQDYKRYYFVQLAKMFTEENYPKLGTVDRIFQDEETLQLKNGERIELKELQTAGVSTNQTLAFIPEIQALVVGDLIHHKVHAWLEGGIVGGAPTPTLKTWTKLLNELPRQYPRGTEVFGGRGQSGRLASLAAAQVEYLSKAQELVEAYIAELGDRASEMKGSEASAHYSQLAQIFAKEFPEYELAYMIEYGIYGLVNQVLSRQE